MPSDLAISLEQFKDARPSKWLKFISKLFSGKPLIHGNSWFFKFDTAFQFFLGWIFGQKTPMHCAVTQSIHCLTKSRDVIDIVNRLGFGSSYDSMNRDVIEIAQMDIVTAGKDQCPVNDCIKPGISIQGAVDNFKHKERTDSGG